MARTALALAADEAPEWLLVMRTLTGTKETPGDADNPVIMGMRDEIARTYPDMADYCAEYTHDSIAWCGLATAYCMTMAGIRPVFGKTDTDRWMWALAWADDGDFGTVLDSPRLGCVVVMERSGGGHVTLYESTSGSSYVCRGGNQSDAINKSSYPISGVVALVWPKAAGPVPPAERRELEKGDKGSDVAGVQRTLGLPADGDFGSVTDAAVKGFQGATGQSVDGVVGPQTWAELDALDLRMATGGDGLTEDMKAAIVSVADDSTVASYSWKNRGQSPSGYTAGIGMAFALAAIWLRDGVTAAAGVMGQADTGDADTDALTYYRPQFMALGMSNDEDGVDTLRHLFVLLMGLGMCESSGDHWCGRDTSAGSSSQSADTCEAGLFQTSWNIRTADPTLPELFDGYWDNPNGFLETFNEDVSPTASGLQNVGTSGQEGVSYQWLAKYSPAFACMTTAVGLRTRRAHWGPIGRREVEVLQAADDFLYAVQGLIEQEPAPGPEMAKVAIHIVTTGNVKVTVS